MPFTPRELPSCPKTSSLPAGFEGREAEVTLLAEYKTITDRMGKLGAFFGQQLDQELGQELGRVGFIFLSRLNW